ncbi:GNAT family N-acetyltransferase [Candidatus Bodocaedibacter vickermanii]|uniref:Ribosomal-protein-alanine acetyltransferase n=1 Tax=Candidatus Bodocaedibacter vickermanii TaxID=2741701 RepID=A0A7L9RTA4_9PROT|nr:ribosomal-protein-alanine acetyltransferase [Candidatus Paracaedibacteraceae bacterium 'Lake Konstanz']
MSDTFEIKQATVKDTPVILSFIKELAEYEKLLHEVVATESILEQTLFGDNSTTEVVIGYLNQQPISFALYFHNFSTFLGRPGIYLEDLFVKPEARGKGIGQKMLSYLAHIAKERKCGRLEWWVLDWNETAIGFYKRIGAKAMDEWTVYRVTDQALDDLAASWIPEK